MKMKALIQRVMQAKVTGIKSKLFDVYVYNNLFFIIFIDLMIIHGVMLINVDHRSDI